MCTPGVGRVDWDRRPRSENRLGSPGGGGVKGVRGAAAPRLARPPPSASPWAPPGGSARRPPPGEGKGAGSGGSPAARPRRRRTGAGQAAEPRGRQRPRCPRRSGTGERDEAAGRRGIGAAAEPPRLSNRYHKLPQKC